MPHAEPKRKLTAILSADVVGYSRMMGADETGTHGRLKALRAAIDPLIEAQGGRIVSAAGDSILADFGSVVDAVRAAVNVQLAVAARNRSLPLTERMEFRIGINLGDVIVDGDDIFGDGVNIAARLQALGDPGGILVSGGVYEQVWQKLDLVFHDRGSHQVKNIAAPLHVYAIDVDRRTGRRLRDRRLVLIGAVIGGGLIVAGILAWFATPLLQPSIANRETAMSVSSTRPDSELPRIAVLPFENRSGDPNQAYFSDGVTEDIITEMSRFSNLIVVPWSAVQRFKVREADSTPAVKSLSVRYLVEGSISRAGERIRATVQLSDAERAQLVWSERYEEPLDEIFALQDRIVRQIVDALAVRVTQAEQRRISEEPTESLQAYDLVLRGRLLSAQNTRAANSSARELFEQAVKLDPNYGSAYAWLARTYLRLAERGWTEQPSAALNTAREMLSQAIHLDPDDASTRGTLASVYLWQQRDDQARAEARKAVQLNPGDSRSLDDVSMVFLSLGEVDEALAALERLVEVDPSPGPTQLANLAAAYILTDRFDDAVEAIERSLSRYPEAEYPFGWVIATAAYQLAGEKDQAAAAADRLLTISPFFNLSGFASIFRNPEDRRKIEGALTAAGLEAGSKPMQRP